MRPDVGGVVGERGRAVAAASGVAGARHEDRVHRGVHADDDRAVDVPAPEHLLDEVERPQRHIAGARHAQRLAGQPEAGGHGAHDAGRGPVEPVLHAEGGDPLVPGQGVVALGLRERELERAGDERGTPRIEVVRAQPGVLQRPVHGTRCHQPGARGTAYLPFRQREFGLRVPAVHGPGDTEGVRDGRTGRGSSPRRAPHPRRCPGRCRRGRPAPAGRTRRRKAAAEAVQQTSPPPSSSALLTPPTW